SGISSPRENSRPVSPDRAARRSRDGVSLPETIRPGGKNHRQTRPKKNGKENSLPLVVTSGKPPSTLGGFVDALPQILARLEIGHVLAGQFHGIPGLRIAADPRRPEMQAKAAKA